MAVEASFHLKKVAEDYYAKRVAGLNVNKIGKCSVYGSNVHLSDYDPKYLQYFGWVPLFGTLRYSAFKSRHNIFVVSSYAVYSFLLIMFVQNHQSFSAENEYLQLAEKASLTLRSVVSFLLAGFVVKVIDEWRTQRQTYTTLLSKAREFTNQVCSYVQTKDPELQQRAFHARRKFGRYIKLSFELATMKGFNLMDSQECKSHLEKLEFLAPGEWEMLANGDRHTTVYMWMHWLIRECFEDGIIGEMTAMRLTTSCSDIRGSANDLNNYLFQEIPYPYAQLTTMLVKILTIAQITDFTLKVSLATMQANHSGVDASESDFGTWRLVMLFATFLTSAVIAAVYQGLLDLHSIMHSPFGNKILTVDHEQIIYAGLVRTINFMLSDPQLSHNDIGRQHKNDESFVVRTPDLTTATDDFKSPKELSLSLSVAEVKENNWLTAVNPMAKREPRDSTLSFGNGSDL